MTTTWKRVRRVMRCLRYIHAELADAELELAERERTVEYLRNDGWYRQERPDLIDKWGALENSARDTVNGLWNELFDVRDEVEEAYREMAMVRRQRATETRKADGMTNGT